MTIEELGLITIAVVNGPVYISGPMTGLPNFNFDAFNDAATRLRGMGFEVINPAETDGGDQTKSWDYYIRKDIAFLLEAKGVAVLPGWEKSRGANLEITIAHALRLPIFKESNFEPLELGGGTE